MPKFIQIIEPQVVRKMTVGKKLTKITGYKLLYNHMTIEMVRHIFDYDKEAFSPCKTGGFHYPIKIIHENTILVDYFLFNSGSICISFFISK